MEKIAVCLLSGGVDSTVAASLKAMEPNTLVVLLSIFYGQGAEQAERQSAINVASWLGDHFPSVIEHFCIEIGGEQRWVRETETPSIASRPNVNALRGFVGWRHATCAWPQSGYPSTRDETFVLMAAAGLEARLRDFSCVNRGEVVLATTGDDICNFSDIATSTYTNHLDAVLRTKLMPNAGKPMVIRLPLVTMQKSEVVLKGAEIGAPLHLTWSCYFGEPGSPCNECDQCEWRRNAFQLAGINDPALDLNSNSGRSDRGGRSIGEFSADKPDNNPGKV